MFDQKNSIFIPGAILRLSLLSLVAIAVGCGWILYEIYDVALSSNKDAITSLTTVVQSLLTAITIVAVLYLFQSSKQHAYLDAATTCFMCKTLPNQIEKHFRRFKERPVFTSRRPRFSKGLFLFRNKKLIEGSNNVYVNHVPGSLIADYRFEKNYDDATVSVEFFLQINIRTVFLHINCCRADFGPHDGHATQLDYVFDTESQNFTEQTTDALLAATPAQLFFSEAARIAWRTIGWQCSLTENGDKADFSCITRVSDSFLHDPSEQLYIANDIASMIRGIADGIHSKRALQEGIGDADLGRENPQRALASKGGPFL